MTQTSAVILNKCLFLKLQLDLDLTELCQLSWTQDLQQYPHKDCLQIHRGCLEMTRHKVFHKGDGHKRVSRTTQHLISSTANQLSGLKEHDAVISNTSFFNIILTVNLCST